MTCLARILAEESAQRPLQLSVVLARSKTTTTSPEADDDLSRGDARTGPQSVA